MEEEELKNSLIIKAPNQNVDDQIVKCNFDWTIMELKKHLSKIYPSKPRVAEQKIIYGGRLLHNHLKLQDILRQEEDEDSHSLQTIHLVCSQTNRPYEASENHSSQAFHQFLDGANDSLRRRNTSVATNESNIGPVSPSVAFPVPSAPLDNNQMPYIQQSYANYAGEQNYIPGLAPVIPQFMPYDMASQMAAYQQLYANYYAQFMQSMQDVPVNNVPPMPPGIQHQQSGVPVGENHVDGAVEPPPQVPNQNLMMNAQGGPLIDDNGNGPNRDWLDYFYLWCRGFVLFSIVYFYSSPERLLLVVSLTLLGFLYQEGWLLARVRNNRIEENQQRQPRPQQNPTENGPRQEQNNQDRGENEIEAVMDGEEPPHDQNADQSPVNPHPAWTLVTSFFSSLIPDPPAPVNIN